MTADQIAWLAASMRDNEAFQVVLQNQRNNALERLSTMPRSDEQAFYAAQAIVAVIDGINADLAGFVRAGAPQKKPGLPL